MRQKSKQQSPEEIQPTFGGFTRPRKNYFPMPNIWTDICAGIDNLAELKIIQYVLRHTWGYQEYGITKAITVDEFMFGRKRRDGSRIDLGTGLKSNRSVKDGIKNAVKHGYLICEIDDTDKGRIIKSYKLNMEEEIADETNLPTENDANQGGRFYPPGVTLLPPHRVDSTPRTEKDTKEIQERKKDTLRANLPHGKSSLENASSLSKQSLSGTNGKDAGTGNEETREQNPVERMLSAPVPYGMKARKQAEANESIARIRAGIDARAASANEQPPTEPRKPRKSDLTSEQVAIADMWDSWHSCRVNRKDSTVKQYIRYLADEIQHTPEVMKQVYDLMKADSFWCNKTTLESYAKQYQVMHDTLTLSLPEESPSTTSSKPSKPSYSNKRVVAPEVKAETQDTFDQWKVDGDAAELRFYLDRPECVVPQHMQALVAQAKEKELVGAV